MTILKVTIEVRFSIGDIAYLKCDADSDPGIVTGYHVSGSPQETNILYAIAWGDHSETKHFGIELSSEPCPRFTL